MSDKNNEYRIEQWKSPKSHISGVWEYTDEQACPIGEWAIETYKGIKILEKGDWVLTDKNGKKRILREI